MAPRFWFACAAALSLLLSTGSLFAGGVSVAAATAEQQEKAQASFAEGTKAKDDGNHELALAKFRASFDIVASPNTRLLIAHELAALLRFVEAYDELRATAADAFAASAHDEKYKKTAELAGKKLRQVRAKIGLVRVSASGLPDGAKLTINGRAIASSRASDPIPVAVGSVTVVLGDQTKTVVVAAGAEQSVSFLPPDKPKPMVEPPPPIQQEPPADAGVSNGVFIAGGVGAAGLFAFGVFGGLTLSAFGDLEKTCPGGACPPEKQGRIDDGRVYQTAANVSLAIGLVGVAAASTMVIMELGSSKPSSSKPGQPAPSTAWELGIGLGGLSIRGTLR